MTHPRALYPKLLQPVDKYRALVLGDLAMSHLPTGEVEESVRLTDSAFKSAALGALTTLPPCPTVSSMAREDAEGVTLMPVSRLSCGRL